MKLPPNDDAALIAASNIAAAAIAGYDQGRFIDDEVSFPYDCVTAVMVELKRRCDVHARKAAGVCVLCGLPFTAVDIPRAVGPDWQMAHLEGKCPNPGEVIPHA